MKFIVIKKCHEQEILFCDRLVFQQKKIPYLNNETDGKERGERVGWGGERTQGVYQMNGSDNAIIRLIKIKMPIRDCCTKRAFQQLPFT